MTPARLWTHVPSDAPPSQRMRLPWPSRNARRKAALDAHVSAALTNLPALGEEGCDEALRCPRQPSLSHNFLELVECDQLEPHEDRCVALEVRRSEVDVRTVFDQRLLGDQMLDARTKNW